jgi:branched-chain amino acid transport system substrate-binding protein
MKGVAGTALALGMPAISYGQSESIKIGHLTPRRGILAPLGDYAVMGIQLAADEINAAGGVNGRRIELMLEDSINPQIASAKAERLIERDKVALLIGEISSASGLAIGDVAKRTGTAFINTGCKSDALRGPDCNPHMFHIEAADSMYMQAVGSYLLKENLVEGKKWYWLTADCAFGHDLLNVAKALMEKNGGKLVGGQSIPTDASDFSRFLRKIRQARPDTVILNLAGNQISGFLTQYFEHGLPFPVVGFTFDTAAGWGVGKGKFSGVWPLVWHHLVDTPTSKRYVEAFTKKYGKPPENQSWANYFALRIVAQSIAEKKSTDPIELTEHLRSEAKFDIGKTREGYFRAYDNQMMMEMYAVRAKRAADAKDQWDIFKVLGTVPAANGDLESIAPPKGSCNME